MSRVAAKDDDEEDVRALSRRLMTGRCVGRESSAAGAGGFSTVIVDVAV